ncbi:MAG: heme ABC transporter permease [Alphaproteobacteria bacterium]|nr:heme ABC transporter permease [Alphaproteobacteria bacterium]
MQRFANPRRFKRLSAAILPWSGLATVILFAAGLWLALIASPRDYQQSETVRIMYVHVPAAWMAMFVYANVAIASAAALVWRHPLAEVAGKAMAPIGACFTALCLITGSLWGKPMWGTWWVWDARLTSVLLLFFLYLGYIALANAFDDEQRGARAAAILAIVGVINLPIIKFSVDWWNTLHQPASVGRMGVPSIHASMLTPLVVMALANMAFFVTVLIWRIEAALIGRRLATRRLLAESAAASAGGQRA